MKENTIINCLPQSIFIVVEKSLIMSQSASAEEVPTTTCRLWNDKFEICGTFRFRFQLDKNYIKKRIFNRDSIWRHVNVDECLRIFCHLASRLIGGQPVVAPETLFPSVTHRVCASVCYVKCERLSVSQQLLIQTQVWGRHSMRGFHVTRNSLHLRRLYMGVIMTV